MEQLEVRLLLATVALEPAKDNTLFESQSGDLSNGAGDFLYAGRTLQNLNRRALLSFDVASAGIPVGSTITDVSLELAVSRAAQNTTATAPFALHRVNQDWGEGTSNAGNPGGRGTTAAAGDATWLHTFSATDMWTSPGGDFQATASATADAGGNGTTVTWTSAGMVADVQAWVDSAATNFGWVIIGDESTVPSARRFNSRENFDQPPALTITFTEPPAETLTLTIADAEISERDGSTTATVSRLGNSGELVVQLQNADSSEIDLPQSIVIADGATVSEPFTITAVDDNLLDGTQSVQIIAEADGATAAMESISVTDFEELSISIATDVILENGQTTSLTVTRTDSTGPLTVQLSSSDTSEASLAETVVIRDGELTSDPVTITAVDDLLLDGPQIVTLTAVADGYQDATQSIEVLDFEELAFVIEAAEISELDGTTTATVTRTDNRGDLVVTLTSDQIDEATVVASVTIPDGQTEVQVPINAVDDDLLDGTQTVTITATAPGYQAAADFLQVTDFETLSLEFLLSSVTESGGTVTGTVSRAGTNGDLVVALSSDDPASITLPSSVTIPAGSSTVTFSIEAVNNGVVDGDRQLTVTASASGLVAGQAAMTVIDNDILATITPSKDNTLFESATGEFSSGIGSGLFVGRNGSGDLRRGLVAFNLVDAGIPVGAQVSSAVLEMAITRTNAEPLDVNLHRLDQDWGEGASGGGQNGGGSGGPAAIGDATWLHTFYDTDFWATPGGDFQVAASSTATAGGEGSVTTWSGPQLVADVQNWSDDPSGNFGWILVGDEAMNSTTKRFASREIAAGTPPQLAIVYSLPAEQLLLTIDPSSFSEASGTAQATVSRSGSTTEELTVTLESSDIGEATLPATIVIPSGETTSQSFVVSGVDDSLIDGSQLVTITASAAGLESASATVEVLDDEGPADTTAEIENGLLAITGGDLDDDLTFAVEGSQLMISDPARLISVESNAASNLVTISLSLIPNGIAIQTGGGADRVTFTETFANELFAGVSVDTGGGEDQVTIGGSGATLALSQFTDVDQLDLRGSGSNSLTIEQAAVLQNVSDASDRMRLLANLGDSVTLDSGWQMSGSEFSSEFFRVLTQGDATLLMSGPADWQNPVDRLDVNNDGTISPVADILPLINEINSPNITTVGVFPVPTPDTHPAPFMDVSGDGILAPVGDVLPIINFINDAGNGAGEGEATPRPDQVEATSFAANLVLLSESEQLSSGDSGSNGMAVAAPLERTAPLLPSLAREPVAVTEMADDEDEDSQSHLPLEEVLNGLFAGWE